MDAKLFVVVVAFLLAGCLGGPAEPASDDPQIPEPSDGGGQPPAAGESIDVPALSEAMQWTDCFGAYAEFYWPAPLNPAPAFDGWTERDPPPPVPTEIRHMVMECQRFGFRTIERGPIQFLVEVTNDRRPPDACLALEPEAEVLNFIGLWTSDQEVADALASEGMPVGVADFALSVESSPVVHFHAEWSMGDGESYLDVYQETAESDTLLGAVPWRLFWHNPAGGVSAIEWGHQVKASTAPPERPVTGELAAPLTMTGPYASTGYHFSEGDFGGTISRFGDTACTEPLSSS